MARYEYGGPHDKPPPKLSLGEVDHDEIKKYTHELIAGRLKRQGGRCTPSVRSLAKVIARRFNISTSGGLSRIIKDYLFDEGHGVDGHGWRVRWFDEDKSVLSIRVGIKK